MRSFRASCPLRITSTRRPPNSDGLSISATSPALRAPASYSRTSAPGSSARAAGAARLIPPEVGPRLAGPCGGDRRGDRPGGEQLLVALDEQQRGGWGGVH